MTSKRRWFLPDTPDVVGRLHEQATITLEGMDAFAAWTAGDNGAGEALRDIEHRGDTAKRELLDQLREAFVTPIAPEDLFALSRGIDWILDFTRDLVRESAAMGTPPDDRLAEMARILREAVAELESAIGQLQSDGDTATASADAAIKSVRRMDSAYYQGMAELLELESRPERIASRELYRRCDRIGDVVIDVAERIIYAVVKES
ncbi:MAG: DUF47 family protein [Solirubrobacterales bacterium]